MRFLADESCDFSVVRALRAAGFDVSAIAEAAPRTIDKKVIETALREIRVLVTEDKDFGQLVFAASHASNGVILIRVPAEARPDLPSKVLSCVEWLGEGLLGAFVVIQPHRIRISRIPAQ
jgi:predicted nuclease of predicted toxin-antitoxin system